MSLFYLEKRDPARNQHRYYHIVVSQTLFGHWAMIREWGRIGQGGMVRETWCDTENEALEAGTKIARQKHKKGYAVVGMHSPISANG